MTMVNGVFVPYWLTPLYEGDKRRKPHACVTISPTLRFKHCPRCSMWKPLSDFYAMATRWDKKDQYCKECRNVYLRRT